MKTGYKKVFEKFAKKYLLPHSRRRVTVESIHLVFLIYTAFALPIYVGFGIELHPSIIILETLSILDNFVYVFVEFYKIQFTNFNKQTSFNEIYSKLLKKWSFWELVPGIIPLNLILTPFDSQDTIFIPLFRMMRIVQVFSIRRLLNIIESIFRGISNSISRFKSLLFLCLVWCWCSAFWFWFNINVILLFYISLKGIMGKHGQRLINY